MVSRLSHTPTFAVPSRAAAGVMAHSQLAETGGEPKPCDMMLPLSATGVCSLCVLLLRQWGDPHAKPNQPSSQWHLPATQLPWEEQCASMEQASSASSKVARKPDLRLT
eukprot:4314296-Prymnesium_polylepis.1